MKKVYHVEYKHESLGWRRYMGGTGTRQFCEGWFAAYDGFYPSPPLRIVCTRHDGSIEIVKESKGRGKPHTN